ncbi:MAG: M48 family metalloprotease [Planctomycetota bacterium]
MAFILGHEAAHHIRGHLKQTQRNAKLGAETLGKAVRAAGGSKEQVEVAARVGALGGLLRYSKEFELAADELGTLIALRAGYDPVLGAQFFDRLPDPGDSFLNTHPPNEERREIVRRITAANS